MLSTNPFTKSQASVERDVVNGRQCGSRLTFSIQLRQGPSRDALLLVVGPRPLPLLLQQVLLGPALGVVLPQHRDLWLGTDTPRQPPLPKYLFRIQQSCYVLAELSKKIICKGWRYALFAV